MPDQKEIRNAQRLARTIASDILLYNREKVERGIKEEKGKEEREAEVERKRKFL